MSSRNVRGDNEASATSRDDDGPKERRAETAKLPVVRFIALVHVTNVMVNRFLYFHGMKQGKYLITYFMDVLTDF